MSETTITRAEWLAALESAILAAKAKHDNLTTWNPVEECLRAADSIGVALSTRDLMEASKISFNRVSRRLRDLDHAGRLTCVRENRMAMDQRLYPVPCYRLKPGLAATDPIRTECA